VLNKPQNDLFVKPDQLCVGLFVHLDLNWTQHPFSFSSFKIEKPDQIATIQKLGLEKIRYSPQKSDCFPVEIKAAAPAAEPVVEQAIAPEKVMACEREFTANLRALKLLWQNLFANPLMVAAQATKMVDGMASSAMMESNIGIHLVIDHKAGADIYSHAMNVTVLSMILAKEMGHTQEEIRLVGLGALFHDVGCTDVLRKIKEKAPPLTTKETEMLHQHCKKGVDICNKMQLPYESLLIVWQHHERIDGSGYPEKLKDKQLSPLANIVAVADAFDELCNPLNMAVAHSAHESLSIIYAQKRNCFDAKALTSLVHCMGVYPPGTLVLLSNGFIGMVVAVNSKRPLKPTVLVYDAANSKNQAIVIDIEAEAGLSVTKTINANQLSPEIFEYFAPGRRTSYYLKSV